MHPLFFSIVLAISTVLRKFRRKKGKILETQFIVTTSGDLGFIMSNLNAFLSAGQRPRRRSGVKRPPAGVVRKFGERGMPGQVSSSSSDHGSKLRAPT
ncbi:hypothetical protein AVEN_173465-1 [Araneus ventricosus]|uniref:Uncharacterized protein n=1 Tax=Araneus ventricosus TaxID=182803 RepID=A0A4Y2V6Z5_ARAVE|nr:hypothetical protein AVEN_103641-1 [Araneus ventricosus]GBO20320.1 hypothetical protein AVEN_52156-1 [Araneus ventricosus]GBO20321.1 hypothetical protein AVEN_213951-1 [Araneus ventricosus]GBO20435.1 hypothetical protein AVEN_173465-1 [Araneus ventricosus]